MDEPRTSANKEITAQAVGAAVATLTVMAVQWFVGAPAPTGMEGALAVLFGAGVGYIRHLIRRRRRENEAIKKLRLERVHQERDGGDPGPDQCPGEAAPDEPADNCNGSGAGS